MLLCSWLCNISDFFSIWISWCWENTNVSIQYAAKLNGFSWCMSHKTYHVEITLMLSWPLQSYSYICVRARVCMRGRAIPIIHVPADAIEVVLWQQQQKMYCFRPLIISNLAGTTWIIEVKFWWNLPENSIDRSTLHSAVKRPINWPWHLWTMYFIVPSSYWIIS